MIMDQYKENDDFRKVVDTLAEKPQTFWALMCPYTLRLQGDPEKSTVWLFADQQKVYRWYLDQEDRLCFFPTSGLQLVYGPIGQPWVETVHHNWIISFCDHKIRWPEEELIIGQEQWCGDAATSIYATPVLLQNPDYPLVPPAFIPWAGIPASPLA